jgi:hypothetical protein
MEEEKNNDKKKKVEIYRLTVQFKIFLKPLRNLRRNK